ncbi:MAG: isochorismatase [Candidatus Dadabacteria bacterium]|nr:isochorismatase [Candidatus Dadabacteria bacterium]
MRFHELPIPPHFDPDKLGKVWKVDYEQIARVAPMWSVEHYIQPAAKDRFKICLVAVDIQNTFCIPGFELYVGGRSGRGAIDDNKRLCEFIYHNLHVITQIVPTMDTHQAMQIFHSIFLVNDKGEHPTPFTLITEEDIIEGRWRFNTALSQSLHYSENYVQRHLQHYTGRLKKSGKYNLTIWPYHAMLGGIGHALVSAVEEAIFFHTISRFSQPDFHVKGNHPLTEHYSVLGPEITTDPDGKSLSKKSDSLFNKLKECDAVIIAGQAKSHCVAWTIADLLEDLITHPSDKDLVEKVYLLEDCTSSVVVPGVVDYTAKADSAFKRFEDAGMHVVRSTDSIETWPGIKQLATG